jgi:hypothetical protein
MNTTELGAAPQTADPTSKMATATRKMYLTEKKVKSLPYMSWKLHVASR